MSSTSQVGPQAITAGQSADPLLQEAVQVAANVSLSYNAPQFFILRASLLYGQPLGVAELVALEGGVQKAVGKLEAQVQDLQQQLEDERSLQAQQQAELLHVQAELEVQLAVGKASEKALQQMLDEARADNKALRQHLQSSQLRLADSQQALAVTTDSMKSLQAQLQALERKISGKQQVDKQQQLQQPVQSRKSGPPHQPQQQVNKQVEEQRQQQVEQMEQQQRQHHVEQQQQLQQQVEQAGDNKQQQHEDEQQQQQQQQPQQQRQEDTQHVTQDEQQDTTRQQDQQQQLQQGADGQQSPASLLHHSPAVRQLPSPLLSPAPSFKRNGHDSPLTPQRPSRIPAAPEAGGPAAPLSYGAVLRKSLSRDSTTSAGGGGLSRGSPAGSSSASRSSVFKFTACPVQPTAASSMQQLFSNGCKTFSAGLGAGNSGGNDGSRSSRRIVRSAHNNSSNSSRQHKQVPPKHPQPAYAKQQKVLADAEGASDCCAEARKRRWR